MTRGASSKRLLFGRRVRSLWLTRLDGGRELARRLNAFGGCNGGE